MKQKIKFLLIILLIIPFFAQPQKNLEDTLNVHTKPIIHKDTIVIVQQIANDKIVKDYEQILEKTNNQLSLWWNPYGLFVAMLGALFAVFAIIAAFVIYRQSKEYKDLIRKSLIEHKRALDKLITEKNNQLKIYDASLDKSIMEYKEQLKTVSKDSKEQLNDFISKLEEQKEYIDTQVHIYRHSGWEHKDILESYPINTNTIFNARVILNQSEQSFVIYTRVKTNDNSQIWMGFAGNNGEITPYKTRNEYSVQRSYSEKEIFINENIFSVFKQGFPELNSQPTQITCIRLRGSKTDFGEITFSYKII